jgi:hypothetical protein
MRRAAQQHGQQMQRTMQHSSESAQMATSTIPTMMAILIHFFCVCNHVKRNATLRRH